MRKWLFLLRAFFPSWRFFVGSGPEIRLEIRQASVSDQWSDWERALPPIRRSWNRVFLNPEGNLLHACHNSLQHLAVDLTENPAITSETLEQQTSYRIVQRMAEFWARRNHPEQALRSFQFRIVLYYPISKAREPQPLLVSPVYEASPP